MKQINIKKPKYIIPILILPFILGIGWLVKDMINSAPAEETTLVETEELNLDIPDANLEKREIKSKFESLKGAFNKSSDYSSIQTIDKEEEVSEIESSGSLYSNDEIRQIDSLNQASRIREKELEQQIKGFPTIDESSQTETRKAPEKSKMQEEMELFKMQMAYIDSLQNPRPRTPQKKQDEKPKEKVAFLQIQNYCIESFENGQAVMADGAYQHVALDVRDIEEMYKKICENGYEVITDGIEQLPFWDNGVKFFMIKGPNEERIEFCQKL